MLIRMIDGAFKGKEIEMANGPAQELINAKRAVRVTFGDPEPAPVPKPVPAAPAKKTKK